MGLAMLTPAAKADQRNQMTQLTFEQPIRIPNNIVLPAGTYWFKLLDSANNQNIVQVFNVNQKLITTTIAASADRTQQQPSSKTMLTLAKVRHSPDVLIKWFYPGDTIGHQFVYSPKEESRIDEGKTSTATVFVPYAPMVQPTSAS
jgi:hypothetical protein